MVHTWNWVCQTGCWYLNMPKQADSCTIQHVFLFLKINCTVCSYLILKYLSEFAFVCPNQPLALDKAVLANKYNASWYRKGRKWPPFKGQWLLFTLICTALSLKTYIPQEFITLVCPLWHISEFHRNLITSVCCRAVIHP